MLPSGPRSSDYLVLVAVLAKPLPGPVEEAGAEGAVVRQVALGQEHTLKFELLGDSSGMYIQ